jgi:hypothetical protein
VRLYQDLAWVWSALTPEGTYAEEAAHLVNIAEAALGRPIQNWLELGSGGGYLASCLPSSIEVTLVDCSEAMLVESRQRCQSARHLCADMLRVDCQEKFDVVLVHDAIMYMRDQDALRVLLRNINEHCHEDTVVMILPDVIKESFYERSLSGGGSLGDRSVLLTEWHWDPDPSDDSVQVEFSLLIREGSEVSSVHESHLMLLLSMEQWFALIQESGFAMELPDLSWDLGGELFLLRRAKHQR